MITAEALVAPADRTHAGRRGSFLPYLLSPLYRLYEKRLLASVRTDALPRHVGIILDGNRRYARKHRITDPRAVYDIGARKLDDVLDWCAEIDVPGRSRSGCSRRTTFAAPRQRCPEFFAAVETKLTALAQDPRIRDRRVRVRALGKLI